MHESEVKTHINIIGAPCSRGSYLTQNAYRSLVLHQTRVTGVSGFDPGKVLAEISQTARPVKSSCHHISKSY